MGFERINEKKLLVRYSYADFDKVQSDSGTKIPSRSVTVLATSLKDANKKWKQYKSQQLNFGHLKVVIFGNGKKNVKMCIRDRFNALYKADVNIRMISTSEIRVTVLVNQEDMVKAMNAAHEEFEA